MISVYDFEEFWLAHPFMEKALLDIIDATLKPSSKTVDGAQIDCGWFDFGGVRSTAVDITHPQFSLTFETVFDPARVAGDKYRPKLDEDERYEMLRDFNGPKDTDAFQPFFAWLAANTAHSTYPAKIKAAAVTFKQIPRGGR